jgi:hypothetical protein
MKKQIYVDWEKQIVYKDFEDLYDDCFNQCQVFGLIDFLEWCQDMYPDRMEEIKENQVVYDDFFSDYVIDVIDLKFARGELDTVSI